MALKMICVVPVGKYDKGALVEDPVEVARILADSLDHHFVKHTAPDPVPAPEPALTPPPLPPSAK